MTVHDYGMVLMNILTSGKVPTHLQYYVCLGMSTCNTYSIVQLVTLAIPSVFGWEAVLNNSEVFYFIINSSQKWPWNLRSVTNDSFWEVHDDSQLWPEKNLVLFICPTVLVLTLPSY